MFNKTKSEIDVGIKVVDFTDHNFGPSKLFTTAVGLDGMSIQEYNGQKV
jgi:hypothetical protein